MRYYYEKISVNRCHSRCLCLQPLQIKPEHHLVDDLGADSLDLAELTIEIEDEFDVEIPTDDAVKLHTVQDIFDYFSAS